MSETAHTKFKVGDKVKVVKKVEQENGWRNSWVDEMDELLGKTFTIDMIDGFGIFFEDLHYGFPPSSLELVTEEPQSVKLKRHKHADVIHAWAEGADVEYYCKGDKYWRKATTPRFEQDIKYRIKPKEQEWWKNIPAHGILVKGENSGQVIALYGRATTYAMWTPLTNEEIERFKR